MAIATNQTTQADVEVDRVSVQNDWMGDYHKYDGSKIRSCDVFRDEAGDIASITAVIWDRDDGIDQRPLCVLLRCEGEMIRLQEVSVIESWNGVKKIVATTTNE